ncbi:MAG: hypothetical protein H6Q58_476 [Firmicutes bacterium]|nr:hypothetical protein [Bacillota bacterium]
MKKYIRILVASIFVFNVAFGTTSVVLADKPDKGTTTGEETIDDSTNTNFVHLHIDGDTKSIETVELFWNDGGKVELTKKGGLYALEDSKGLVGINIKEIRINGHKVDFVLGTEGGGTINVWLTWDPSAYDNSNGDEAIGEEETPAGSGDTGTGDPGTGTGDTETGTGDTGSGTSDTGTGTGDTGTGTDDTGTGDTGSGTTDPGTNNGGTNNDGTNNNGGTNNDGTNDNGSGSDDEDTVIIIEEEETPLGSANLPSNNNDTSNNAGSEQNQYVASAVNNNSSANKTAGTNKQIVEIEDEETPLGSLPQTGGVPFSDLMFLGTGLSALGFMIRKRK